jgi:biopolymer transport protein ExbD
MAVKFRKGDKKEYKIDLIPMINIVFLLLIFFMLTSSAIQMNATIQLPRAYTAEAITNRNVIVVVESGGALELNGNPIAVESLLPELTEKLKSKRIKAVEIQGDQRIEFETFGKIIDIAKQAGAVDFFLAAQEIKK